MEYFNIRHFFIKHFYIRHLLFCLILAVSVCLASAPTPVNADLLWEPDDDFLLEHEDECIYESRNYNIANASGYASVYENPESKKTTDYLDDSQSWIIEWIYTDSKGTEWGYVAAGKKWNCGWVRMDQLEVVYDSLSFIEEYVHEIYPAGEGSYVQSDREIITIWDYPGGTAEEKDVSAAGSVWNEQIGLSYLYKDEAGLTWGYVDTFYAYGNFWLRVADFTHRNIIEESTDATEGDTEEALSILSTQRNRVAVSEELSTEESSVRDILKKLPDNKLFIFSILAVMLLLNTGITILIMRKFRR